MKDLMILQTHALLEMLVADFTFELQVFRHFQVLDHVPFY
jgi:hypothetical protein